MLLVDNLDRIVLRDLGDNRTMHHALYVEHGEQLRALRCHAVYTLPISVMYSERATAVTSIFPDYQVLPMLKVKICPSSRRHCKMEGLALGNLGIAYSALGQAERAIEYYKQALAIAREMGDRQGEAFYSWNLGLQYEESDPDYALELMQAHVDYEREIGHPAAEGSARRVERIRARIQGWVG